MSHPDAPGRIPLTAQPPWIAVVRKAADSLHFGIIQIKIHDGEVVQIETTQKFRLEDFSSQSDLPPTEQTEAHPTKSSRARPTTPMADLLEN